MTRVTETLCNADVMSVTPRCKILLIKLLYSPSSVLPHSPLVVPDLLPDPALPSPADTKLYMNSGSCEISLRSELCGRMIMTFP